MSSKPIPPVPKLIGFQTSGSHSRDEITITDSEGIITVRTKRPLAAAEKRIIRELTMDEGITPGNYSYSFILETPTTSEQLYETNNNLGHFTLLLGRYCTQTFTQSNENEYTMTTRYSKSRKNTQPRKRKRNS